MHPAAPANANDAARIYMYTNLISIPSLAVGVASTRKQQTPARGAAYSSRKNYSQEWQELQEELGKPVKIQQNSFTRKTPLHQPLLYRSATLPTPGVCATQQLPHSGCQRMPCTDRHHCS